ncbi:MAG TPA: cation:proton antiporter [Deltaproteobacteria bacterium]|nr:cation:proton antiporter [Deltaproteobacteria bacterium]
MNEYLMVSAAGIVVLGITAQWLAWRLHLPAILLLLLTGLVAGPLTGFLDPDILFGPFLHPAISLSVAVILFEGGLSLNLHELKEIGRVLYLLTSVGTAVSWVLTTGAAYAVLGLPFPVATLLGAILVVTGPTVIGPLLRHIRPTRNVASLLKWEGIVIDPIGAVLAVLVFEVIQARHLGEALTTIGASLFRTVSVGVIAGMACAWILSLMIRRHWIPEFLQSPVTLMAALGAFVVSNGYQSESGLLTVTVMGIALANRLGMPIRQIREFKENLRVLLISSVFIVLAARFKVEDMKVIGPEHLVFIAVLVLLVRPVSVYLSTLRSGMTFNERAYLAMLAPRGIVAAAVSTIFASRMETGGFPEAAVIAPITFFVIIATVAFYSIIAHPLAIRLKVARSDPQGVLVAGAQDWARAMAKALKDQGILVRLIDTNWKNVTAARQQGLSSDLGNVLSEDIKDEADLEGIGRLLALTSNDQVNTLAALNFMELFGKTEVYQLDLFGDEKSYRESISESLRGRILFRRGMNHALISQRYASGWRIRTTKLTSQFGYQDFLNRHGESALPLLLITEPGKVAVFTTDGRPAPRPGQTLISLTDPSQDKPAAVG